MTGRPRLRSDAVKDDDRYRPAARRETVLLLIACALAGVVLAQLWVRFG